PVRDRAGSSTGTPAASTAHAPQAAPPAPTSCTLRQLPLPDGRQMALVTGADPSGRYLLGRTYPAHIAGNSMGLHVVIWDRMRPTLVPLPGDDQSLVDINRAGVAVGNGFGSSSGTVAYYYRAGMVAELPGGTGAEVRAINDAGTAVGGKGAKALLWRSVDRAPVELALPAGATYGQAVDIDEDGTVVGNVGTSLTQRRPYVWAPDGSGHYLPIPPGVPVPTAPAGVKPGAVPGAVAYHIRNGWVIGRVNATAVRWNLRTGQAREYPEFADFADAVNGYGWQIGLGTGGRALFLSDGSPVLLPELAKHQPGNLSNLPTTLSDDGTLIGGQSDDSKDVIHAVVWTCS
ncbi:MAG TPA: hypothetical protein VJT31_07945, partial [Rugosimonospora sp.]|nr:hypothetical protein [Rugosimonospora sp.]